MGEDKYEADVQIEVVKSDPPSSGPPQTSPWKERIHNFTWQWHVVVMATGGCSSLLHNFPYHSGSPVLRIMALSFFLLDLFIFMLLCAWTVVRCVIFPEDWSKLLTDPAKALFIGFFANGVASLLNAALAVHRDWGMGNTGFLFVLWGFWWLDCLISCIVAFGLVYVMIGQRHGDMTKVGPAWMVPIISMITISASGGLFTRSLLPVSRTLAIISVSVSSIMLLIGLSFTMMFTTAFLLRLYLHGPLDPHAVLSTFTTLTPLGQGGYSLLLNGEDLANLFPAAVGQAFPNGSLVGQMLFSVCFCGAYLLWSMGVAWVALACFSIVRHASRLPRFSIATWCVVVPNAVFAALSVQMATVLDSPFFRAFGALWSVIVMLMWTAVFLRSIPALIDGSIFVPPASTSTSAAAAEEPPGGKEAPKSLQLDLERIATLVGPPPDEEKCVSARPYDLEAIRAYKLNASVESIASTLCSVETAVDTLYSPTSPTSPVWMSPMNEITTEPRFP